MPFPTQRLSRIALITLIPFPALFLILTFTTWLVTPPTAYAGSCNPPTTHPTIQAAVDDPSCTLITLDATTYTENVVIDRSLTLAGQAAAQQSAPAPLAGSLITGTGTLAPVIQITGGQAVTLTHLTLAGGAGPTGGGIQNNGGNLLLNGVHVVDNNVSQAGGGLWSSDGSVTIRNSTIQNNRAVDPTGGDAVTIENSQVTDNETTGQGGGIFNNGGTVTVTTSIIAGNRADNLGNPGGGDEQGGGLWNGGGDVDLINVTVDNNAATERGGGIFNSGGTLDITDSSIVNNSAVNPANLFGVNGGGISVYTGAVAITGTLIADNSATFGAGANFFFALANISNSTIRGNDANPSLGAGGGANIDASTVAMTATVVSDNSAGNGGGIKATNFATFSMEESTVASNNAGGGGGLFIDTIVPPIVNNVVVTGNVAAQDGGGLFHVGPILTVTGSLI